MLSRRKAACRQVTAPERRANLPTGEIKNADPGVVTTVACLQILLAYADHKSDKKSLFGDTPVN